MEKKKIKKTITLPKDLVDWAEKIIKSGEYPGIRSLSGFIEFLLWSKRNENKDK